eukprot:TRINITY_DN6493_c0_g3_i2.p9 TRINITY_DN6493_c0_g3~~TRINITY_DN6493_c0_g3_i2.p9  ORF type:complete len:106 (+),score=1.03 TRINITY_DN6493_c0_g3_i2:955-1272(+)
MFISAKIDCLVFLLVCFCLLFHLYFVLVVWVAVFVGRTCKSLSSNNNKHKEPVSYIQSVGVLVLRFFFIVLMLIQEGEEKQLCFLLQLVKGNTSSFVLSFVRVFS